MLIRYTLMQSENYKEPMQSENDKGPKKLLNSICEVQIDGKMALVSLYDDLPHFEYDMTIDNLKNSNTNLKKCIQELKECNQKLEKELLHFKFVNKVLSKNITSLYKTASCEIQRKDKIIEELRRSQIPSTSVSKMFRNNTSLPPQKSEFIKSSEKNKEANKINYAVDTSKELNQMNDENNTNVVIQPNRDIPKTVYYKRLCQKLVSQNETIKSKTIMPKNIKNSTTNTSDKITIDSNELESNKNMLKEMSNQIIISESEENLNSSLDICKPNITPNDSQLDTPVVQYEIPEKIKNNVSSPSFFSKLKNPVKLKKKMVIAPATIGVQNISIKALTNVEKINRSKNVDLDTQCIINNSPQNKNETLIKDTQPTLIKEQIDTTIHSKTDDKPLPVTEIIHNKHLSTYVNYDQILPAKLSSPINCKLFSTNIESKNLITCAKSPTYNEKKYSSSSKQNQSENKLPALKGFSNSTKSTKSINSIKSCINDKFEETSLKNKSSIHIDVEQIPIRKRTVTILKDINAIELTKVTECSLVSCINPSIDKEYNMSTKSVKDLTMSNENELVGVQNISIKALTNVEKLNRSKNVDLDTQCIINNSPQNKTIETLIIKDTQPTLIKEQKDTTIHSKTDDKPLPVTEIIHNEHLSTYVNDDQILPVKTAVSVPSKSEMTVEIDNTSAVTKISSPISYKLFSTNIESKNLITCAKSPTYNEKKSSSSSKQNQSENKCPVIKGVRNSTKSINSIKSCINNKFEETSLKNKSSIHIDVEQIPIKKRTVTILKDINAIELTKVNECSLVSCINPSIDKEYNMSTKSVKDLTMSNENKLILSEQKKNQSEHKLLALNHSSNLTQSNSSLIDNLDVTSLLNNTSINIETEHGSIFRRSKLRKVIMHENLVHGKPEETKKGRRVKLITIKDHCTQPLHSFNGAKKKEIDVSKSSIHIEKVVESSSLFYIPQVKRRRTIHFSDAES